MARWSATDITSTVLFLETFPAEGQVGHTLDRFACRLVAHFRLSILRPSNLDLFGLPFQPVAKKNHVILFVYGWVQMPFVGDWTRFFSSWLLDFLPSGYLTISPLWRGRWRCSGDQFKQGLFFVELIQTSKMHIARAPGIQQARSSLE